jgi:hypothetical protein
LMPSAASSLRSLREGVGVVDMAAGEARGGAAEDPRALRREEIASTIAKGALSTRALSTKTVAK